VGRKKAHRSRTSLSFVPRRSAYSAQSLAHAACFITSQHLANLNTVFKFLQSYVKLVDIGPQVTRLLCAKVAR
jgi:hypothetical protein